MGNICGGGGPKPIPPTIERKPSYNHIVRGNFIPQQNGDLKVHEEQSSIHAIDFMIQGLVGYGDVGDHFNISVAKFLF